MSSFNPELLHSIAVGALLFVVNMVFAYDVVIYEHHHVHAENALLENLQAAFLGLGVVTFLLTKARYHFPILNHCLALLCFSFMLRELDVERLGLPRLIVLLGSGTGKYLLLGLLWLWVTGRFIRCMQEPGFTRTLLASTQWHILLTVLGLLAVSTIMDREWLSLELSRLVEELAETNAYLLMLSSSISRLRPTAGAAP